MHAVRFGIILNNQVSPQARYNGQPIRPHVDKLGEALNTLVPGDHIPLLLGRRQMNL